MAAAVDLDAAQLECGEALACWRRRLAAAAEAADRADASFGSLRAFQDLALGAPMRLRADLLADLEAAHRERASRHPGDPGWAFLAARLVKERGERIAALEAIATVHPAFPWAHLELAKLRSRGAEPADAQTAAGHLERFVALCPGARGEVLELLHRFGDRDLWARLGPPLRAAAERQLAERGDHEPFPWLWRSEFQFTPPAEHEALRNRVRGDLARLRDVVEPTDLAGWYVLDEGYEIVGDTASDAWVDEQVLTHLPCSFPAPSIRRERFEKEHPEPPPGDQEAALAHQRALLEAAGEWTRRCPDDGQAWAAYLEALGDLQVLGEPAPAQGVADAVSAALAREAAEELRWAPRPSLSARAAALLLTVGRDLDRVPELVASDLLAIEEDVAVQRAWAAERDHATAEGDAGVDELARSWRLGNRDLAVRGLLALGRLAEAEAALAEAEALLAAIPEGAEGKAAATRRRFAGPLRRRRAELAGREGRRLDAVAHLLGAGVSEPTALAQAERRWLDLGGTAEGWAALTAAAAPTAAESTAAPAPGRWAPVEGERPLPPFAASDLTGRRWRSEELRGRVLLVSLWATWCAPCRPKLAQVEELHLSLAGVGQPLVLTLNVDDNPGLVQPFVTAGGWSFPVLLVGPHYRGHDMGVGIPRSWIVDREGQVVWEEFGFKDDPAWIETTRSLLDQASNDGAASPAARPPAD